VTLIDDDMLLGLDFLAANGTHINLRTNTFSIGQDQVPMYYGPEYHIPMVAKVTVPHKTVIPANSLVYIQGKLDVDLGSYIVESSQDSPASLMIPRGFYGEDNPRLCFVNATNNPYTIRKNAVVAQAMKANELEKELETPVVHQVQTDESRNDLLEVLNKLVEQSASEITPPQREKLKTTLAEYEDIFSVNEFDIGTFKQVEHSIDTGNAKPIHQRLRRTPISFAEDEERHLKKMLEAGVVEPSLSEWASPPVLIRKRDGSVRYAIDYRKLNEVTKKEVYPLPLIEECLDTLAGNEWFSKLDASSAYWQVKMREEDKPKTAFITKYGLFQLTRISFGLCNAPATYARAMQLVLRGLTWEIVLAFLDDILVMGRDLE